MTRHAPCVALLSGLIVIAPAAFEHALADFIAFKRGQMPTEFVALETALAGAEGCDDAERLKRALFAAWRERGAQYALLVGDADVLPVRYMVLDRCTPEAFDYAFYPSDLYYADLARMDGSFEDWNARKDGFHAGYFGEVRGEKHKDDPINFDQVDYLPEIAVGRWPVSTPEEAARVAAKSVAYERGILDGTHTAARTAGLVAVGGWVDCRAFMDRQAARLPAGWRAERRYDPPPGESAAPAPPAPPAATAAPDQPAAEKPGDAIAGAAPPPPPTEAEVVALLNAGVGLVLHAGHGNDDCWERCISIGSLARIQNGDRLPVMISAGCSTAAFAALAPYQGYTDASGVEHAGTNAGEKFTAPPPPPAPYQRGAHNITGLGEALLRAGPNGAVAYIGCNTGSQPCGLTLLEGFVKGLSMAPEPRLGDLWNGAIRHYWTKERLATLRPNADWYPPSIFFQGMKFMVFGDPSLRIAGPQTAPPEGRSRGPSQ
jgi:hypothetical protein